MRDDKLILSIRKCNDLRGPVPESKTQDLTIPLRSFSAPWAIVLDKHTRQVQTERYIHTLVETACKCR